MPLGSWLVELGLPECLGTVLGFMADSGRNRNKPKHLRQLEGYILQGKGNYSKKKSERRQGPRLS